MVNDTQFITGSTASAICKAKSADANEWVIGYYSFIPANNKQPEEHFIHTIPRKTDSGTISQKVRIIPDTLCRFTGALDTNCEMIFENDVAKILSKNCAYPLNESVVSWSASDFAWCYSCNITTFSKKEEIKETMGNANYIEITGNILD